MSEASKPPAQERQLVKCVYIYILGSIWGYTRIMKRKMETTIVHWGYIGIVEIKWKLLFRVQKAGSKPSTLRLKQGPSREFMLVVDGMRFLRPAARRALTCCKQSLLTSVGTVVNRYGYASLWRLDSHHSGLRHHHKRVRSLGRAASTTVLRLQRRVLRDNIRSHFIEQYRGYAQNASTSACW